MALLREQLDNATRTLMKSFTQAAAEEMQAEAAASGGPTPVVVKPDQRVRLTSGHEIVQYNVPQSHLSSMVHALKSSGFEEQYNIKTSDISYIVKTDNYWLTVDKENKRYYVAAAMLPAFFTCPGLPPVTVPEA